MAYIDSQCVTKEIRNKLHCPHVNAFEWIYLALRKWARRRTFIDFINFGKINALMQHRSEPGTTSSHHHHHATHSIPNEFSWRNSTYRPFQNYLIIKKSSRKGFVLCFFFQFLHILFDRKSRWKKHGRFNCTTYKQWQWMANRDGQPQK